MNWQLLLDNWANILGLMAALSFLVSPVVLWRWLRTRNELTEIQTFIKKNKIIREEIAEINEELSRQAERIRALELELLDEKLRNKRLQDENETLRKQLGM